MVLPLLLSYDFSVLQNRDPHGQGKIGTVIAQIHGQGFCIPIPFHGPFQPQHFHPADQRMAGSLMLLAVRPQAANLQKAVFRADHGDAVHLIAPAGEAEILPLQQPWGPPAPAATGRFREWPRR